jgi:hypothetical protein
MAAPKGNKFYLLATNIGRKRKYKTVSSLQKAIIGYFEQQKRLRRPRYTISGLCVYLGFECRETFDKQVERGKEFSDLIKKTKQIVESCYEDSLYTSNPTGAIFALKNMGWRDKSEVDQNIRTIQPLFPDVPTDDSNK